ncbi:MAG TPA: glycosyltransferase family 2 protein [Bacteroidia bacterium]|nr:glycosyltransferase family 2 protein [Bacteroidia bacterium]HNU34401.1 glycosyltransferase family 2 protein [Bacteroidia bacterium]
MKLAIVILNYNGKELLQKFLPSLIEFSGNNEIIVADNSSTDDSIAFLRSSYPTLRIILMNENTGYAGGYNNALKQVEADVYCLINSDIEVTANWINPVIETMLNDDKIGACQPKILSYNNKAFFEHAGAAGGFIDMLGYPFCRGRIINTVEPDDGQYNDVSKIFWATGACLFVRAQLFHQINGFDKDFFAHMEEIDLCWRIQKSGYTVNYIPKSVVYHVGGATLSKSNPRKTYFNFRNNILMLHKNLGFFSMLLVMFIRHFLDLIAALKFFAEGHRNDSKMIFKAYAWFYGNISSRIKLRRQTRKGFAKSKVTGVLYKSLVISYYLLGRSKFSHFKSDSFSK